MTVATLQTAFFGADPFSVDVAQSGTGVIMPQYKLGSLTWGDAESEFVYCKFTPGSNITLTPGLLFTVDDDFTATLLTTSNSPRGSKVMVSCVGLGGKPSAALTSGTTYYLWLARAGQFPVAYTTIGTAGNLAETTATAGAANFPNAATVGSKLIVGLYITKGTAPATFTANTTNGSAVLTGISGLTVDKSPFVGQTITGAGIPGSTTISSIAYSPSGQVSSITLSANATANGTGITVTPTLAIEARVMWPYVDKTN